MRRRTDGLAWARLRYVARAVRKIFRAREAGDETTANRHTVRLFQWAAGRPRIMAQLMSLFYKACQQYQQNIGTRNTTVALTSREFTVPQEPRSASAALGGW